MDEEATKQVQWMRKHGVLQAEWANGALVKCTLGAEPHEDTPLTVEDEKKLAEKFEEDLRRATYGAAEG